MQTRTLYGIFALFVAVIIIVSSAAAFFYYQYNQEVSIDQTYVQQLKRLNVKYLSNILIDYDNGTLHWYNNTQVQPGWNLYVATLAITNGNVNATLYGPPLNEHFVTGINGVQNTQSKFWFLWTWNSTALWQIANVGADLLPTYNESIYAWTFCGSTSAGNPTCTPP